MPKKRKYRTRDKGEKPEKRKYKKRTNIFD